MSFWVLIVACAIVPQLWAIAVVRVYDVLARRRTPPGAPENHPDYTI